MLAQWPNMLLGCSVFGQHTTYSCSLSQCATTSSVLSKNATYSSVFCPTHYIKPKGSKLNQDAIKSSDIYKTRFCPSIAYTYMSNFLFLIFTFLYIIFHMFIFWKKIFIGSTNKEFNISISMTNISHLILFDTLTVPMSWCPINIPSGSSHGSIDASFHPDERTKFTIWLEFRSSAHKSQKWEPCWCVRTTMRLFLLQKHPCLVLKSDERDLGGDMIESCCFDCNFQQLLHQYYHLLFSFIHFQLETICAVSIRIFKLRWFSSSILEYGFREACN